MNLKFLRWTRRETGRNFKFTALAIMRLHRVLRGVLGFCAPAVAMIVCACSEEATAQQQKKPLAGDLVGCWSKSDVAAHPNRLGSKATIGRVVLCFDGKGGVTTAVLFHDEALGTTGMYRADRETVELLGFPGDGWPSSLHHEQCRLSFNGAEDRMLLADCGLAGEWKSAPGDK